MFRIEWGEGPGKFHYEESQLGFEADAFPRKYVRDRQGNFYFLEPGPPARLSKFSGEGRLVDLVELAKVFPSLTPRDVITPQELFLRLDGQVGSLLRVYLKVENREEIYLAYFNAGKLGNLIRFPNFKTAKFQTDNASFLDREGYLWILNDGGTCDIYASTGELVRTVAVAGSFVDFDGRLYSGFNPLKLYARSGDLVGKLLYDGHLVADQTGEIAGANGTRFLFSWRRHDKVRQGDLTSVPRVLDLFRLDIVHSKVAQIGSINLPSNRYRNPDRRSDYVERTELYEDRLIFDDSNNAYFLGRSPKECWIEKVHLEIK